MSDYDEDFEEYDDDGFEEEEEYEVLPKAMAKPTSPPASAKPTTPPAAAQRPSPPKRPTSAQRPMEIPQTPLLSDAELKARNRRLMLSLRKMKQIQLQVVAMDDMFVMATLSEYDLYCMARGQYASCKVVSTQTNDDAKEEESQTEEITYRHFGSQVPDDRNKMTDAEVFAFSVEVSAKAEREAAARSTPGGAATARVLAQDPALDLKLAAFMQWAGPVMLASLGMSAAGTTDITFTAEPQGSQLGAGVVHLTWPDLLAHRPVTSLALCPAPGQAQVLAAYAPVGAQLGAAQLLQDHGVSGKGCLCVWDLGAPSRPKVVLLSEGMPSCCAWVPAPAHHVVVAGMDEGGVCAWDLEEPESRHPLEKVGQEMMVLRRPSYSSEAQVDSASAAPVRAIACVSKQGGDRTSPCTVLSLSAWGDVTVFSLSVMGGMDGAASASDTDLGVRIGSRVRLLRGTVSVRLGLQALQPHSVAQPCVPCHCLAVLQGVTGPSAQVLVGTEGARTLRGSWLGTSPAPKQFLTVDSRAEAAVSSSAARKLGAAVTCLAVSPWCPQGFLVGMSNGTLALHSSSQATAVQEWVEVGAGRIVSVHWAPSRPACFMALDASCVVHYFDLTQNMSSSVQQQAFMVQAADGPSLTTHLAVAGLQPQGKAERPVSCFALGYDDGSVDVHRLADQLAHHGHGSDELQLLQGLLSITAQQ